MNLLTLAPDLQERILLQPAGWTEAAITERQLRPIAAAFFLDNVGCGCR